MENFNLKKFFFYLLICSVSLSALMGIWAILFGEFGDTQGKVLLTTLTVVGTSILGLACGAFLEKPQAKNSSLRTVPIAGIACAVLCAITSFILIWSEFRFDKGLFKVFFVSLIFAFSLAQLSLLTMARLAPRFYWSLIAAYITILLLDSIVSTIIVFELQGDDGWVLRIIGILSVVAASLTVMIPIFHYLSRTEYLEFETVTLEKTEAEIERLKAQLSRLEKQREDILNAQNKEWSKAEK